MPLKLRAGMLAKHARAFGEILGRKDLDNHAHNTNLLVEGLDEGGAGRKFQ